MTWVVLRGAVVLDERALYSLLTAVVRTFVVRGVVGLIDLVLEVAVIEANRAVFVLVMRPRALVSADWEVFVNDFDRRLLAEAAADAAAKAAGATAQDHGQHHHQQSVDSWTILRIEVPGEDHLRPGDFGVAPDPVLEF